MAAKRTTKKAAPKKAPARKKVVATKKQAKPVHPLMVDGRDWDRELVMDHICDKLATSSRGLGNILLAGYGENCLPSYSTVMKWMEEDKALSDRYTRAKEAQADFMADEILDVADDGRNDWMEQLDKEQQPAGYKLNGEHVQRSRLRVESRKWLAAKLKPKKYGDRTEVEHSGTINTLTDEQVDAKLAALMAKAQGK